MATTFMETCQMLTLSEHTASLMELVFMLLHVFQYSIICCLHVMTDLFNCNIHE